MSSNRATAASSRNLTGTVPVIPSGPVTPAVRPAAAAGKNSSSASPTRTVCGSGFADAKRRSSCWNSRKLGKTGHSVQSRLSELV
ncbi:hypothetical protein J0H58_27915 [bacterium]|nr:hypothetical protein [bacterium]